jgi:hypothetical protein
MANALFMVPNPINSRSTDSVECLSREIGSWLPKLNFGKPAAKQRLCTRYSAVFGRFGRMISRKRP